MFLIRVWLTGRHWQNKGPVVYKQQTSWGCEGSHGKQVAGRLGRAVAQSGQGGEFTMHQRHVQALAEQGPCGVQAPDQLGLWRQAWQAGGWEIGQSSYTLRARG